MAIQIDRSQRGTALFIFVREQLSLTPNAEVISEHEDMGRICLCAFCII